MFCITPLMVRANRISSSCDVNSGVIGESSLTLYMVMTINSSVERGGSYSLCRKVYLSSYTSPAMPGFHPITYSELIGITGHGGVAHLGEFISLPNGTLIEQHTRHIHIQHQMPPEEPTAQPPCNGHAFFNSLDFLLRLVPPHNSRWDRAVVHVRIILVESEPAIDIAVFIPILLTISLARGHDSDIAGAGITELISTARANGHIRVAVWNPETSIGISVMQKGSGVIHVILLTIRRRRIAEI